MSAPPAVWNLRSVQPMRQAHRTFYRGKQLVMHRPACECRPESVIGTLVDQAMNIPQVAQAAVQFAIGKKMRGAVDDHVGRVQDIKASGNLAASASMAAASGRGRAVSGKIVWCTSIIRSRSLWISGGSSCIWSR